MVKTLCSCGGRLLPTLLVTREEDDAVVEKHFMCSVCNATEVQRLIDAAPARTTLDDFTSPGPVTPTHFDPREYRTR